MPRPSTSHNAKKWRLIGDRVLVLGVYVRHPQGLTDHELTDITGRQYNSIGKRRTDLYQDGYIENSGLKKLTPNNSSAIIWRVTPEGVKMHELLEVFGYTEQEDE